MIELQDILWGHGSEFLDSHHLSITQMKAFRAILDCRTSALGGHVDECDNCGHQQISYNSCRNRHCPKCQALAKEQWIDNQERHLLNVGYFHVVFTLPSELHAVALQNQEIVYSLFFKAVSETLLGLGRDQKYLGATLGITAIIHTWGQNLLYHPHIHCVVPGGGLTGDSKWRGTRKKFFIPVKVLSRKFRGKLLAFMRAAKLRFGGSTESLADPAEYGAFFASLYSKDWVVYCKPPFGNAGKTIQYLGRYTHRVAISNNRILSLEDGKVTFKWRDYADSNKIKEMTIAAVEFIRRFMLHVLPSGFRKIRHYGLLAPAGKERRLRLCKRLTFTIACVREKKRTMLEILTDKLGDAFRKCPSCGTGTLIRASPV
jgi:hypothetical protein